MGVMGNKGAVLVRLSLYDSTLCFVCAHMAAKRANVQGRNSDFWSILAKTSFTGDPETAWWVTRPLFLLFLSSVAKFDRPYCCRSFHGFGLACLDRLQPIKRCVGVL